MVNKNKDVGSYQVAWWIIAMAIVIHLSTTWAKGEKWQWTPPDNHHASVVSVSVAEGGGISSRGSGVYVTTGEVSGILTAAHLFRGATGSPTIRWGCGQTSQVTWTTTDKYKYDIAWLTIDKAYAPPLQIATTPPQHNEWVEFVTYGGPEDSLRHFSSHLTGDGQYAACVVPGDSGGAILNRNREVIGIQAWGNERIGYLLQSDDGYRLTSHQTHNASPIYQGSGSATYKQMAAFVGRVETQCIGGVCRPQWGGILNPNINIGNRVDVYPPKGNPPVYEPPQEVETTPPPINNDSQITDDLQQRVEALEQIAQSLTDLAQSQGQSDTDLQHRLSALENKPAFDPAAIIGRLETLESKLQSPLFTLETYSPGGDVRHDRADVYHGDTVPLSLTP